MIYFLRSPDDGPIKIGFTDDLPKRISQLETRYGIALVLLAIRPGGREEEKSIHRRFSRSRIGRSEQFLPDDDLMKFIGPPMSDEARNRLVEEGRKLVATTVDRTIASRAKTLAGYHGISVAELISETLRGPFDKLFNEMLRKTEGKG